jgi:hypothetical protein
MPDAAITTIAEAVTTLINGATLSQTVTAQRCYIPNYDIQTTPGLQIFVLATDQVIDIANGDRSSSADTYTLKLAIYKQLTRTDGQIVTADMDAMIYFVQQVSDLLKANDIEGTGGLIATRNKPLYDPAQLDKNGTFLSVLEADYLLFR